MLGTKQDALSCSPLLCVILVCASVCVQDTENCGRHNTGQERNNDREHQVPPVIAGVQVGDGHAGVDPGVVAWDGGVLPTKLTDPEVALDSRRIPTTLHIDKESSPGQGRCGEVVLL